MGSTGNLAQGPDGALYEWVQGVDGLGNPVGFWKKLRRLKGRVRGFVKRALPFAQRFAPFIPGASAALTMATPFLQRAGVAGYGGLGALYQAADGTVYQMQGLGDQEELQGFLAEEELQGLAEDEELRGLDEDDELRGLEEDDELRGLEEEELQGVGEDELQGLAQQPDLEGYGADDELSGLAEDDAMQGLGQGYVRQDGVNGIDGYVPQQAPTTRWWSAPGQPPELWKPLW
jgi:hypothetical protein